MPLAQADAAASTVAQEAEPGEEPERYMVPAGIWTRFKCTENGGAGWTAKIARRDPDGERVWVRFLEAKTRDGKRWCNHPLRETALVRLDVPSATVPIGTDGAAQAVNAHPLRELKALRTCALSITDSPPPYELMSEASGCETGAECDASLFLDAHSLPPHEASAMMIAAMRSGPPKAKPTQALVTVHGAPTWIALLRTAKEAAALPNAPRWKAQMVGFVDKLFSMDGVRLVAKSEAAGRSIYRTSWVFKYKTVDGAPVEKARLVFNNTSVREAWAENTYSDSVKSVNWKMLIHDAMVDGADVSRRDIVSAHQTTRRDPNGVSCFSYCPPGLPYFVDGPYGKEEAIFQWLNMLNGMPPAGNAFSGDL